MLEEVICPHCGHKVMMRVEFRKQKNIAITRTLKCLCCTSDYNVSRNDRNEVITWKE